jgi:hypothetical protein
MLASVEFKNSTSEKNPTSENDLGDSNLGYSQLSD